MNKWTEYKLPDDMSGRTFLDVGCWEGNCCVEAVRRNARHVVGVDLCTSEDLRRNVDAYDFEFLQLDVLSEKFLELAQYEIVLCSGVLYHVENVLSLLFRLRKTATQLLVLETAINTLQEDLPILLFHPEADLSDNPSNWWTPNRACLFAMLDTCGFSDITVVYQRTVDESISRLCVHAVPTGHVDYEKVLPRKASLMSLYGGDRSKKRGPAVVAGHE